MQLPVYLGLAINAEEELADAFKMIAKKHATEVEVVRNCKLLSGWSTEHVENLKMQVEKYGEKNIHQANHISSNLFKTKPGSLGVLRDLHGLWLLACEVEMCYMVLSQGAKALRDSELELMSEQYCEYTGRQKVWLQTKIKSSASQVLIGAGS